MTKDEIKLATELLQHAMKTKNSEEILDWLADGYDLEKDCVYINRKDDVPTCVYRYTKDPDNYINIANPKSSTYSDDVLYYYLDTQDFEALFEQICDHFYEDPKYDILGEWFNEDFTYEDMARKIINGELND